MSQIKKMTQTKKTNIIVLCITIFAFSQFIAYIFDLKILRAIGASSCIAPYTKVFSNVDGIETFASDFYIIHSGKTEKITPELYSKLGGSYNRRNVYGAAFSYGPTPKFPKKLFKSVFEYAFIEPGPLAIEMMGKKLITPKLKVISKTKNKQKTWILP